ncbi:heme-binding domain-containing protein [Deminuibacter soli]|uniref:Cytochrome P460 n=1 Tax=Deminuibacter soli TaxID=2291815 RepID=A0A3E1NL68_9BACT|nr:heme-binding domain-containing protein [Deminuibacter soli]RFM28528.1 cytochrome P460 [Deminuibacter soli]
MNSLTRKSKVKKVLLGIIAFVVLAVVVLQFTTQPLTNPPVTGTIEAPKEVMAILQRSCFNCHSNETKLAWFDKIAPLSWRVKADVEHARQIMNFSEWDKLGAGDRVGAFWGITNMVKFDRMPLKGYRLLHPDAKLSPAEVEIIRKYTESITHNDRSDSTIVHDAQEAFAAWRKQTDTLKVFPKSPNGVVYTDEFKKWKVISMSTLFENSMRVIYGNDIAVKAVENEQFHPWPDGAVVVKAVWEQAPNEYGEVRPGKFINAQFLVKDGKQYTETEGWGFAKFSGNNLTPYGHTANFATTQCISCHRQLAEETGYLFSVPLKVNPKQ